MRVPSSFCGLYGIRPTHGRIDVTGMLPQAPTSDTDRMVRARRRDFAKVCAVMLGEEIPSALPSKLIVAVDAFGFADAETSEALQPMVKTLAAIVGSSREEIMAPQACRSGPAPSARCSRQSPMHVQVVARRAQSAFRLLGRQGTGRRSMIPESDKVWANLMRQEARGRMKYLLPPGTILCLPTTPFPAPKVGLTAVGAGSAARPHHLPLCARRAGGLSQVNLPGATTVDGLPVGLSIIGPRGSDATLVSVARAMEKAAG